jgi:hypothetical protein
MPMGGGNAPGSRSGRGVVALAILGTLAALAIFVAIAAPSPGATLTSRDESLGTPSFARKAAQ